jgi:putative transposase
MHGISQRQALRTLQISASVYRYKSVKKQDDAVVQEMLCNLSEKYPTWGFWMMYHKLRNMGRSENHKRVYRIYKASGLSKKRRSRKRAIKRIKKPLLQPLSPNQQWSMDFMRDSLFQYQPFRAFNVIDDYNREALNITIAKSITSQRVIAELEQIIQWRGKPESIRVDNGPEFIAQALQDWCAADNRNIALTFIQPGKPSQNGYIERFNRTFREDVLDRWMFIEMNDAQKESNKWIWFYNNERPHAALNYLSPRDFLLKYGKVHRPQISAQDFPTFQQDLDDDYNEYQELSLILNATK